MATGAEGDLTPAALVARIGTGDPAAEAALVERFGRGLRTLVHHLVYDASRAEDLYQETLRRAIEKLRAGEVREPDRLAAFLAGLARNLAIGDSRKRAAHPTTDLDEQDPPVAPEPSPQDLAIRRQEAHLVRKLLAELEPERDRQILFRFYLAEEPKERICADFGLSSLHFNRVVHRARERFRSLLQRQEGRPVGYLGLRSHPTEQGSRDP